MSALLETKTNNMFQIHRVPDSTSCNFRLWHLYLLDSGTDFRVLQPAIFTTPLPTAAVAPINLYNFVTDSNSRIRCLCLLACEANPSCCIQQYLQFRHPLQRPYWVSVSSWLRNQLQLLLPGNFTTPSSTEIPILSICIFLSPKLTPAVASSNLSNSVTGSNVLRRLNFSFIDSYL